MASQYLSLPNFNIRIKKCCPSTIQCQHFSPCVNVYFPVLNFIFFGNDRERVTQTSHQDLLSSPRSDFKLNYCYSLLKCIKIFLVVVFSMLFRRHRKFPTCIKVIVPFVDVWVLYQILNYSSWRLSIEVVLQHKSFFITAFCCLPCTECTIFEQRDHCYLAITFFLKLQLVNLMIQRIMEQYYIVIIFYSTNFFFSKLHQTVDLSHDFLHRWPTISLC